MKRKQLIVKLAIAAVIIAVISLSGVIYENLHETRLREMNRQRRDQKIAELTREYQKYLDETAKTLSESTVTQELISRINSYVFNKRPNTKLYLWMTDKEGTFVFGVPSADFVRLNRIFDKHRTNIEKEGNFVDRNDFLLKLTGRQDEISFSRTPSVPRYAELEINSTIRIIENIHYPRYRRSSNTIVLSSPIVSSEQQVSGDLYMKVDNENVLDIMDYRNDVLDEILFPLAHILLGISTVFLWILIPSWIYIDARQRDVKRAFMWAFLTVITFGFAAAIYLVTRPAAVRTFLCPECEKELNGTKAFCPHCGFDLSSTFCPQCQYQVKADWQFCPNCRFDLTSKAGAKEEEKGKEKKEVKGKKEEEKK